MVKPYYVVNHHPSVNLWVPYDRRVYKVTYDLLVDGKVYLNFRPNGDAFYIDLISDSSLRPDYHLAKIDANIVDYIRVTPNHRRTHPVDLESLTRMYGNTIPSVKGIYVDGQWITESENNYHIGDIVISKTFPMSVTLNNNSYTHDFDITNILNVLALNGGFPDAGNIA